MGGGALAGGFEFVDNGAVSNGRGGAFTARASDATALMLNVAGIGTGSGRRLQLYVGANLSFYNNCFQRAGRYDGLDQMPDINPMGTVFTDGYINQPYPQVCNAAAPFPAPNLMATYAVTRRFAVGFGVYGPNSVGRTEYPDRVTTANGVLAPGPARYVLNKEDLLIIHPTLAASYEVVPGMLRLGVGLQPSLAHFQFTTYANALGGQDPRYDLRTEVNTTGFFLAGNLGVLFTPTSFLQVGAQAHLSTNVTLSGTGRATANAFASNPMNQLVTENLRLDRMSTGLPHQFRLGLRFVIPRAGQQRLNDPDPARPYDPMLDERADIELDGMYETSSAFKDLEIEFNTMDRVRVGPSTSSALPRVAIPHAWRDVLSVRLGGDVNLLPGRLAVRAGVAYETAGALPRLQNLDLAAPQTLSFHLGGTWRFANRFAINVGYAHHLIGTVDNTAQIPAAGPYNDGNAGLRLIGTGGLVNYSACNDNNMAGGGACTNNRGTFTSSLNVLTLGVNLAF
jgi:long-subunit fatty acid transport protein